MFFDQVSNERERKKGITQTQTEKQAPKTAWISTEKRAIGQHKLSERFGIVSKYIVSLFSPFFKETDPCTLLKNEEKSTQPG